jgi:ribonucleoside-diphosphate reductase beta chain
MKKVIDGDHSLNLAPIKYKRAWKFYLTQTKLFWLPSEVGIGDSIKSYKHDLTEVEKHVFDNTFAQLSTMDVLAGDVLKQVICPRITSPEHQLALSMQIGMEAIHSHSYQYCIDNMSLDEKWLWSRWEEVPEMKAKITYSQEVMDKYDDGSVEGFLACYYFLAVMFEGTWFGAGFSFILAMGRSNKVKEVSNILQFIMRDELAIHWNMGIQFINDIINDGNEINFTKLNEYIEEITVKGLELEDNYCDYIFSKGGYLGLQPKAYKAHIRSTIKRSFKKLDIRLTMSPDIINNTNATPLSWLNEMVNINKDTSIFGRTNTEYSKGGLSWEET